MRTRALIPAALLAAALAGCSASVSTSSDLDIAKLQSTIASEMQSQLDLPAQPTVTCPQEVQIEQGNTFNCTAELDGDSVDILVTQNDDQGNVSWEVVQPSP